MPQSKKFRLPVVCLCFVTTTFTAGLGAVIDDGYQNGTTPLAQLANVFVNGKFYAACSGGYVNESGLCVPYTEPQCPPGYLLIKGLCYLQDQSCPPGYYLRDEDMLCYPIVPLPCPFNTTTASSIDQSTTEFPPLPEVESKIPPLEPEAVNTSTSAPETTTLPIPTKEVETTKIASTPPVLTTSIEPITEPAPAPYSRCPPGTVFTADRCRQIICTQGEYFEGRCWLAACPEGTVWRGRRCQLPAYVTTILEIENVFLNEAHHKPGYIAKVNSNNVTQGSHKPESITVTTTKPNWATTTTESSITTPQPIAAVIPPITTTTRSPPIREEPYEGCCSIVTPRICKRYDQKWVCFHRRNQTCDHKICTHPIIYLKAPMTMYDPPILVMPPNPPLKACIVPNCDNADAVDCSGCPHNRRETCSPHCYRYMCPLGVCSFMDMQEYCTYYPGQFGCTKPDGCIWMWCN